MNRIILVTEMFYPAQSTTAYLLTRIALRLAEEHKILVITGPGNYDGNEFRDDSKPVHPNIEIRRVATTEADKNGIVSRLERFIVVTQALMKELRKEARAEDIVFSVTNPAPLLLSLSRLKKKRKFHFTLLVHDVFPENTIPAGLIKSHKNFAYRIAKKIFDNAYGKADTLIVLGRDMAQVIKGKIGDCNSDKIHVIENWATFEHKATHDKATDDVVEIQYAGNLGRVQGLENILDIASLLKDNSHLKFTFWGTGALKGYIQQRIDSERLDNVHLMGTFTQDTQAEVMSTADIELITLSEGMYGLGVPSKAYNVMKAGKPILYIGDTGSEISLLVKEADIGYTFEPHDKKGITAFLNSLNADSADELRTKGERAEELAKTRYSESAILDKYQNLFSIQKS